MAEIQLPGGHTADDPRLGRVPQFDARSLNFPITEDPRYSSVPRSRTWGLKIRLDQGQTPACTGFSRAHDLAGTPKPAKGIDNDFARRLYLTAQTLDEYPGENYDGSSVLGATKAAVQFGFVGEYRWAGVDSTPVIDDVIAALGHIGPVIVGTDWREGMFRPRSDGLLDVTGNVAGGHAYMLRGVALPRQGRVLTVGFKVIKTTEPLLRVTNSWGTDWGLGGDALIKASDMEGLLKADGEACITTQAFAKPKSDPVAA